MAAPLARVLLVALVLAGIRTPALAVEAPRKIGVLYIVHGGFETYSPAALWNSSLQIFSYDHNSPVYQRVIWNPQAWPKLLAFGNAPKERGKYAFEFERIGNVDPFGPITARQLRDLDTALEATRRELNAQILVDWMAWVPPRPEQHAHPRLLYGPGVPGGAPLTYCGSEHDGGEGPDQRWPGCNPQRFDIDGAVDRMLKAGVNRLVLVDTLVGGVRFGKTYDVVSLTGRVVADHNRRHGTAVDVVWVNDPTGLMRASFPAEPPGWTRSLGAPTKDRSVPLRGRPNPLAEDAEWAQLFAEGIEARFLRGVAADRTGVLLINHPVTDHNEWFDPKTNDTLALNENIRSALLKRHPGLKRENVLDAWMGLKVPNPNIRPRSPELGNLERSREMRGENLGAAWLYESPKRMPPGDRGLRYWEALDAMRARGVRHIVVAFPQTLADSVLTLVEVPNQIAKEIGFKSWEPWERGDFKTYPAVGHPFADYWGIWVNTQCRPVGAPSNAAASEPCCLEMGGCGGSQPYPPPRQTPIDEAREDLDPSLAFDVSEYGHLGYDAARGAPNPDAPVQDQYRGTWVMARAVNDDPRVGRILARHVSSAMRPD